MSSKYAHLGEPDAEWLTLSANLPKNDTAGMTMLQRRAIIAAKLAAARQRNPLVLDETKVQKTMYQIPIGDGAEIRAAGYVPVPKAENGETEETTHPLMVFFHGGGFALIDLEVEEARLTDLAINTRISVLNVGYRKAPEDPFPAAVNDAFASVKWGVENASKLKVDVSKGLMVGGTSSGGNLAAVVAILVRDDPSFPAKITGRLLQGAPLIHPDLRTKYFPEIASPDELADEPQMTKESLDTVFKTYLPDPTTDPADPRISPILAPSHKGLPPTFFQINGMDPLRDEAFVYERFLKEAGVPTKAIVYPGVPHGFRSLVPTHRLSKQWTADTEEAIAWFATQNHA